MMSAIILEDQIGCYSGEGGDDERVVMKRIESSIGKMEGLKKTEYHTANRHCYSRELIEVVERMVAGGDRMRCGEVVMMLKPY